MRFAVLGSGSGGNATVVEAGGRFLMIDAGLSAKQLSLRLEDLGISPSQLTGILLTHEHGDHARGLDVFLKKWPVPVVATTMTSRVLQEKMKNRAQWVVFQSGQTFEWEGFQLKTFTLPHDAVEPVGYVISDGDLRIGIATDLGHVDHGVRQALDGVEGLVLEANYEWRLLEADLKRPFSLKQRISSQHGHLSNEQAGRLLAELVPTGLRRVILGHLSSDCNCPDTAMRVIRQHAGNDFQAICATQDQITPWQVLDPPTPAVDPEFYGELFAQRTCS